MEGYAAWAIYKVKKIKELELEMNGYRYILEKQSEWAKNKGIELIGSKVTRGRPSYTLNINENIFQPLLPDIQKSFFVGDGNELGSAGMPGKCKPYIHPLH